MSSTHAERMVAEVRSSLNVAAAQVDGRLPCVTGRNSRTARDAVSNRRSVTFVSVRYRVPGRPQYDTLANPRYRSNPGLTPNVASRNMGKYSRRPPAGSSWQVERNPDEQSSTGIRAGTAPQLDPPAGNLRCARSHRRGRGDIRLSPTTCARRSRCLGACLRSSHGITLGCSTPSRDRLRRRPVMLRDGRWLGAPVGLGGDYSSSSPRSGRPTCCTPRATRCGTGRPRASSPPRRWRRCCSRSACCSRLSASRGRNAAEPAGPATLDVRLFLPRSPRRRIALPAATVAPVALATVPAEASPAAETGRRPDVAPTREGSGHRRRTGSAAGGSSSTVAPETAHPGPSRTR